METATPGPGRAQYVLAYQKEQGGMTYITHLSRRRVAGRRSFMPSKPRRLTAPRPMAARMPAHPRSQPMKTTPLIIPTRRHHAAWACCTITR